MDVQSLFSIFMSMLSGSLRVFIPIAFAALAFMVAAECGHINMALDGQMLFAAFFGVYGSHLTGSPWIGLLFAIVFGIVTSLLLAVMTIHLKCPQVIAGLGINMLASGFTVVLMQAIFSAKGKTPVVAGLNTIKIPFFSNIPIIGDLFSEISPLLLVLIGCMLILRFVIKKTPFGLRMRVTGENPVVAASHGIDVYKMQYICVILSGVLASIGGACLSIGDINLFSRDMVSGRGFIGIAVCIFGGYDPVEVVLASLLFGFAQSLQYRIQGVAIPSQLVQMLPYLLTMIVLAVKRKNGSGPVSLGLPYEKEGQ